MKIIGVVILMLMILPLVFAATDTNNVDDIFRVNTRVDYKKPCFNNGTYCSSVAVCNYTVFNPDNTILMNNNESTNQNSFYNVSFIINDIGIHKVDMVCWDGGLNGAETLYFESTGSGFHTTIWFYVLILSISGGIMVMGFKLLDPPIVILGTFGLYFLGIYTLLYGIAGMKDLVTTWATGLIILGVAFYVSAKSSWELING